MRIALTCSLALALAACADYPRDVEGTLDRVRTTHQLRVGLAVSPGAERGAVERYIDAVAKEANANAVIVSGPAEPLLARLEEGELDLVMAEVARDSPWAAEVAIIEPLRERVAGRRSIGISPIARNGENQWIALLERQSRDLEAGP